MGLPNYSKRKILNNILNCGVSGQDGSYLSDIMLSKGYDVFGMKRRSSTINTQRIEHLFSNNNSVIKYGDVAARSIIIKLIW